MDRVRGRWPPKMFAVADSGELCLSPGAATADLDGVLGHLLDKY